jgi:tetratricopeptide (TPR) repeat protein
MLSVVDRNNVLDEAEALSRMRDFAGMIALLEDLPYEVLLGEPEVGHYLALAYSQSDLQLKADDLLNALATACAARGNDRLLRRRLNLQAVSRMRHGDLATAESIFRDVQLAADVAGDTKFLATATMNLGVVADIRCDWDQAMTHYHYALILFQNQGDRASMAACYHNLGMLHRQRREFTEAEAYLDRAMENYRPTGTSEEKLATALERSLTIRDQGDAIRARAIARHCLQQAREMRNHRLTAECLRAAGMIDAALGLFSDAEAHLLDALKMEVVEHDLILRGELFEELAAVAAELGDGVRGPLYLDSAVVSYKRLGSDARATRAVARFEGDPNRSS